MYLRWYRASSGRKSHCSSVQELAYLSLKPTMTMTKALPLSPVPLILWQVSRSNIISLVVLGLDQVLVLHQVAVVVLATLHQQTRTPLPTIVERAEIRDQTQTLCYSSAVHVASTSQSYLLCFLTSWRGNHHCYSSRNCSAESSSVNRTGSVISSSCVLVPCHHSPLRRLSFCASEALSLDLCAGLLVEEAVRSP